MLLKHLLTLKQGIPSVLMHKKINVLFEYLFYLFNVLCMIANMSEHISLLYFLNTWQLSKACYINKMHFHVKTLIFLSMKTYETPCINNLRSLQAPRLDP